jgi:hypothetical protein
MKQKIDKMINSLRKLPEKKSHLDFFAAILAIPMMTTIIIINILNLQTKKTVSPTPTPTPVIIKVDQTAPSLQTTPISATSTQVPSATPSDTTCKKGIGPISIDSPQEGQTVTANPVCIAINYDGAGFCSIAWSYKINGSDWSDYTNTSVCLYNLPTGNNTFTLNVKSTVGSDSQTIIRHFTYAPTSTITPTVGPSGQVTIVPTQ